MSEEGEWRALVDPRSKKVYYVNMLTRKTTWTNPHGTFFGVNSLTFRVRVRRRFIYIFVDDQFNNSSSDGRVGAVYGFQRT